MEYGLFGMALALAFYGIIVAGACVYWAFKNQDVRCDWIDVACTALAFAITGTAIGYAAQFIFEHWS